MSGPNDSESSGVTVHSGGDASIIGDVIGGDKIINNTYYLGQLRRRRKTRTDKCG